MLDAFLKGFLRVFGGPFTLLSSGREPQKRRLNAGTASFKKLQKRFGFPIGFEKSQD